MESIVQTIIASWLESFPTMITKEVGTIKMVTILEDRVVTIFIVPGVTPKVAVVVTLAMIESTERFRETLYEGDDPSKVIAKIKAMASTPRL